MTITNLLPSLIKKATYENTVWDLFYLSVNIKWNILSGFSKSLNFFFYLCGNKEIKKVIYVIFERNTTEILNNSLRIK